MPRLTRASHCLRASSGTRTEHVAYASPISPYRTDSNICAFARPSAFEEDQTPTCVKEIETASPQWRRFAVAIRMEHSTRIGEDSFMTASPPGLNRDGLDAILQRTDPAAVLVPAAQSCVALSSGRR